MSEELTEEYLIKKNSPWELEDISPIQWLENNVDRFVMPINDICVYEGCQNQFVSDGVYFLIDGYDLIYIGKSHELEFRLQAHKRNGVNFDQVRLISGIPRTWLEAVEDYYIYMLQPTMNNRVKKPINIFDKYLDMELL